VCLTGYGPPYAAAVDYPRDRHDISLCIFYGSKTQAHGPYPALIQNPASFSQTDAHLYFEINPSMERLMGSKIP